LAKKIVVCCDGTGNTYGDANSNVLKVYSVLPKNDPTQVAFYDPGVGTFSAPAALTALARWWTKVLGFAFGYGIRENIADAYRYLMNTYEEGDQVFVFGFSRGAYTARALAALIYKCGLLSPGNENLIPYAIEMLIQEKRVEIYSGFRRTFSRRCGIHFMGLWDTVKSVGWIYNPLKLQFTRRNPILKVLRHAVSIDERRCFYRQNLWGEPYPHQDIKQVWFAGAHSDVGGSYPEKESGLSQIALQWMLEEAVAHDLIVDHKKVCEILGEVQPAPAAGAEDKRPFHCPPNIQETIHKSLHGGWWLLEIAPKLYEDPKHGFKTRLKIPLGERRFIAEGSIVHRSVAERMSLPDLRYAPPNLPQKVEIEG
jgi:uncharacterized protein (DUF2235 family)